MEKNIQLNPQELQIQGLLDRYLASRNKMTEAGTAHIDEDSLSAFVEGTLNAREAENVTSHLVDCGFCRHASAELIRLELAFAEEEAPSAASSSSEPTKMSEVLGRLFSKIFGTADGAVFAHEEKTESEEKAEDEDEKGQ
ncbi:MAG: hypothetical protein KIT61_18055 [Pyrinomonadaceae bacterium]|nr:hypothetical protein [Pyrinomonadaceae bacterium]